MSDKKIALLTGSFDPLTLGHYDIALRAAKMFDTVYVVGFFNSEKKGYFSAEERLEILRAAFKGHDNIIVDVSCDMVANYAEKISADVIVKGIRTTVDFAYEHNLAEISRRLSPNIETVFIPAKAELSYISSTYVREMIKYNHSICDAVPENCIPVIKRIKNLP